MRLFGQLSSIYVSEEIIFYHNTFNQNGKILKATGQVQSRNTYTMCDFFNYVKYDSIQKVIQLFNNGFSILAQTELNDKIDYCLIGLNGEFIIITGKIIFSTINERFQKILESQIIYAGYIYEIPTIIVQKTNRICVYSILNEIQEDYCLKSLKGGKVIEFGKTLIYYDNQFAYNLKDKNAREINIELIRKTSQFLGFSQTLVIRTSKKNKQIVDLKGQVEYEFHSSSYVVENLETQKYYFFVKQEQNQLIIESLDRETQQLTIQIIQISNNSIIISVFLIDLSKRQFLIQYQDLQTILLENKSILWSTEQSLISIENVFYQQYVNEKQTIKNSYYESLKKNNQNPFFLLQNAMLRILNEIKDFKQIMIQIIDDIRDYFNLEDNYIKKMERYQIEKNIMQQSYGLKQKVCFLTTYKTLLCYDSIELQLLQKAQINNLDQSFKLVAIHKIDPKFVQNYNNQEASQVHILLYYSDQKKKLLIFLLDLSHGMIQQMAQKISKKILWTFPYKIGSSQYNNLIVLIDEDENVFTYPKNDQFRNKEIILYRNDNGILKGYKLIDKNLVNIWSIYIKEKIQMIRSSYEFGQENGKIAIWDDRKVIYKLIDHSNFAILTSDEDSLKLYILNAKTGKVIFQSVQNEADLEQPINLVFDEHQVFVTYYNQAQMMFEIWTTEIYHSRIEFSFINMLEDYYFSLNPIITNYYQAESEIVFLQQIYGYPLGIKHLGISKSKKSLTKKNLLIITTFGQLHSLDRNIVSARRRISPIIEQSLQSTDLSPYQYEIPINFFNILTGSEQYDFQRFSLEVTKLESSTLLLLYGPDIYFTIIQVDKSYDMLQEDFNYDLLIITVMIAILATQVLHKLLKFSQYRRQFQGI
ncbi:unnamed protein product [Paramecium sonneborni]|uniref:ER membrane protein complex subunit 1 n=1 Tax=Paramecium sonneborni TaxID=65129 RepID=A0A8S1KBJ7_9CILI|nr:unnamed protein product [Paramecium sonneborni]